eukprot:m.64126 g.64126  ORF g.64126 m.64126 type:complete len:741 (+) comp12506_c0_seq1:113-2335(+)
MLVQIFTLNLAVPISPRLVTVGRFDGRHPCLACATSGGRVFIHNPHGDRAQGITYLNINKNVTALSAGRLDDTSETDILLVGSPTDLLAYDVSSNKDVFFKELPDGVFAMCVGHIGALASPLVFVGGKCSIQGLDITAQDVFWTVTGDNVCSLALSDIDGDEYEELVVGSEDFDMRVFREDGELVQELSHSEAVTFLCPLNGRRIAFALANGTVGVLEGMRRLWSTKMKNQAVCLHAFDCNLDGQMEVVVGWADGAMDVRDPRSGTVLFSEKFPAMIAGIVQADYRLDGTETLMVCTVEGEVRGLQPIGAAHPLGSLQSPRGNPSSNPAAATTAAAAPALAALQGTSPEPTRPTAAVPMQQLQRAQRSVQERALKDLLQQRNDLRAQLRNAQQMTRATAGVRTITTADAPITAECMLRASGSTSQLMLVLSAPLELNFRMAVLSGEGLFAAEKHVFYPPTPTNSLAVPITPSKNAPVTIAIQALIESRANPSHFLVRELSATIPRFARFMTASPARIQGRVSLAVPSAYLTKVQKWVSENFLLSTPLSGSSTSVSFVALDNGCPLFISMEAELVIATPDGDVAGDVVQALLEYLGMGDLNSICDFPQEIEEFTALLTKVNECHAARTRLAAGLADSSTLVKGFVVRAEDARSRGDIVSMKQCYEQLGDLNRDLMGAYTIRGNNHAELLARLKDLNAHIQRVARWRGGKAKAGTVALLREAIKNNDTALLHKTIKIGCPAS